ncbi:hypothetical protein KAI65_02390 [Candidatus Parcubacteria bacterium]|nr:hypothetical protein [Candidatus Parcubacteria bacterium]
MLKTKKQKKYLAGLLVISIMIAMYGFIPSPDIAGAVDAIEDAKDTITDSDASMTATHTFNFKTNATTTATGYWRITFPEYFTGISDGNAECAYGDGNFVASSTGQLLDCAVTGDQVGTTTQVVITGVGNPATTSTYYIEIENYNASDVLLERVRVAVVIVDDVLMTAKVDSSLTFAVSGTSTAGVVGGIHCANASTATNTPFGTLAVGATSTVCQTLNVTTNADDGYTVTVEQDDELTSDSLSNINSFNNSPNETGSTTPEDWVSPTNTLDAYHTYGHMGLHSDDSDLETGTSYEDFDTAGATLFAGLNTTDPMPVMHHDGPSNGVAQNSGEAHLIYQVEIGSLQEAGDYENTLTYICTPTF